MNIPFEQAYENYYKNIQPVDYDNSHGEILRQLDEEGMVVLHDFFPPSLAEDLYQKSMDLIRNLATNGDNRIWTDGGLSLIENVNELIPESSAFFEDETISSVAQGYSNQLISNRRMIRYKQGTGQKSRDFQIFDHFDTWKLRLKVFLYLHDVGDEDAPFIYLKGSHKGEWRYEKEKEYYEFYTSDEKKNYPLDITNLYLGCHWPHEVSQLKKEYGFEHEVCTASAGSVILFDARGLHQGPLLKSSHRLVFSNHFQV